MIIERVEFDIQSGKEVEFLAFAESCRAVFAAARGCKAYSFGRGVENPSKVTFLIGWDSVQAHVDAGAAGAFAPFVQGIGPFLAGTPRMEHFDMPSWPG